MGQVPSIPSPGPRVECLYERLTDELVVHVFSYLPMRDICLIIPQVNHRFKKLSENDKIWKRLYLRRFKSVYIDETCRRFKYLFMLEILDGRKSSGHLVKKKQSSSCACELGTTSQPQEIRFATDSSSRDFLHQGAKLVILGDVCTGKTSILIRLVKGHFVPYHEATIGASFLTKQMVLDDVPVKFEIWDTAGSERYYSLAPMYYRGAVAALCVYDITAEETFDRALKWISEVEQNVDPKPIVALIGNKLDLEKSKRLVSKEKAAAYAKEAGLLFMETSAKTGEGITEIFLQIAKDLIQKANAEDKLRG